MIRKDEFRVSHKTFAVDLGSLRGRMSRPDYAPGKSFYQGNLTAAWFRRKRLSKPPYELRTYCCIGVLKDYQPREDEPDAQTFLEDLKTGYADCVSRWDGTNFWSASQNPDEQDKHRAFLKAMLENRHEVPPGFTGWWRFA